MITYEEILGIEYLAEMEFEDIEENIDYYTHTNGELSVSNCDMIDRNVKNYLGKPLSQKDKNEITKNINTFWDENHKWMPWKIVSYFISFSYDVDDNCIKKY